MQGFGPYVPTMIGGAADLIHSTFTSFDGEPDYSASASSRNVAWGVREHGMGAAVNGLALHGGIVKPFCSTFFVFTDYMRPPIRLSALMKLDAVWIFSHDSVAVGEDGPTHQPVEHLAAMRAIPNLTVIRPADANEVSEAWGAILEDLHGPVCLVLSRQNVTTLDRTHGRRRLGPPPRRVRARRRGLARRGARRDRRRGRDRARRARPARREGRPGTDRLDAELGALRGPGRRLPRRGAARRACRRSRSRRARRSAGRAGSTPRSASTPSAPRARAPRCSSTSGSAPPASPTASRRSSPSSRAYVVKVSVGFTPAEQVTAPVGIVIDVLRATSTICQALAAGYESVVCVGEIDDARALAGEGVALAGERHNVRIEGFDFGNSPREFAAGEHPATRLVLTTTNGTRLLLAAAERCETVLVASLLNLDAVVAAARGDRRGRRRPLRRRRGRLRDRRRLRRRPDRRRPRRRRPTTPRSPRSGSRARSRRPRPASAAARAPTTSAARASTTTSRGAPARACSTSSRGSSSARRCRSSSRGSYAGRSANIQPSTHADRATCRRWESHRRLDAELFCGGDDRGIDSSQREVAVLPDEPGDP